MASFDATLPPDVSKYIFSYLSSHRKGLAACRLVCKDFKALSSEYLFRRVVFAKRLDTIDRLWNILEDTKLRTFVTELVYDASTYEDRLADDFEDYEEACSMHSARVFFDPEANMQVQKYGEFYRKIFPKRRWKGVVHKSQELYEKGTHKGFCNYFKKWLDQSEIIEKEFDSHIIKEVLVRLPRLRHIRFTDFRELAQEGVEYATLCERLYGNTLEPQVLSFSDENCREFMMLLNMIAETPQTNIRSLSIGGHSYESFIDFWTTDQPSRGPTWLMSSDFDPPALHYEADYDLEEVESMQQVRQKLRQLRLPIRFQSDSRPSIPSGLDSGMGDSFVGKMLASSASSLVQLSLSALDLLERSDDNGLRAKVGGGCLDSLLCAVTFPNLRYLELYGWPLPGLSFQEFLSRHSSSLQELCLDECIFPNDPRNLGRWARINMYLDGVNMNIRIEYNDGQRSRSLLMTEIRELESLWLAGRSNTLE